MASVGAGEAVITMDQFYICIVIVIYEFVSLRLAAVRTAGCSGAASVGAGDALITLKQLV